VALIQEISSVAPFKNMFNCTPREIPPKRKAQGLRTPYNTDRKQRLLVINQSLTQIRIESRDAFQLNGRANG